jgi:quercetin dioxygenase-like cupin family protein
VYTVLTGARAALAVVRLDLRPGRRSNEASHPGEEWLHVVKGNVVLTLAGADFSLEEGDSIHFDSAQTHRLRSSGRGSPTVLIASTASTAPMQHPLPATRRRNRSGAS